MLKTRQKNFEDNLQRKIDKMEHKDIKYNLSDLDSVRLIS
jgi:hypothetical protein